MDAIAPLGLRIWKAFPREMHRSHSHEDLEVNLVIRGTITCLHGPRIHRVNAGQLAIFWAGVPHNILEISDEPAPEGIWMTIPLEWFLQWQLPGAFTGSLFAGNAAVFPAETVAATRWVELTEDWMRDLEGGADHHRVLRLELESRMLRLILAGRRDEPDPAATHGPPSQSLRTFLRVVEYLHENFARDDLSAETVARAVGLHPKYLLALFPKVAGITFLEYLHRLRIAQAKLRLLETRETILRIAADVGFRSPSTFYSAFARCSTEGLSPALWRRRLSQK